MYLTKAAHKKALVRFIDKLKYGEWIVVPACDGSDMKRNQQIKIAPPHMIAMMRSAAENPVLIL
jgi:hypothetical protein